MEKRALGKTGEQLSVVGFGGIVIAGETQEDANRLIQKAIERGINYFDVSPTYGNAEELMGPALKPYRDSVFLACKTSKRLRDDAWAELNQSLERLKTDHLDLYQHHAATTIEEVDLIMSQGGAMEAFLKARDQGLVRYLGFSAHSEAAALALIERFEFDSLLFPINWASWLKESFGAPVMVKAQEAKMGIVALKALAKRNWEQGEDKTWPKCWYKPVESPEEASLALRFALSLPITAAISPSHAELLWWMCDAADHLTPLTQDEAFGLERQSKGLNTPFPLEAAVRGEL